MSYRWIPFGPVTEVSPTSLLFQGAPASYLDTVTNQTRYDGGTLGYALCNARFNGGTIGAKITFKSISVKMGAGITLASNPSTGAHLTAMLGAGPFCSIRAWVPPNPQGITGDSAARWIDYQTVGVQGNLKAEHAYEFLVDLTGSRVKAYVDGVHLIDVDLKENLLKFSPGAWFLAQGDIEFNDFQVVSKDPTAFVVMEFSQPFDDLYTHVIKPICKELSITTLRADERHGPGMILADIERQIAESAVVIADVTPVNANVFYEVGYAHALRKPTILLAQRGTKLPFDISGFRTIFYDNTIEGKLKVETGLEQHLNEVLSLRSN